MGLIGFEDVYSLSASTGLASEPPIKRERETQRERERERGRERRERERETEIKTETETEMGRERERGGNHGDAPVQGLAFRHMF